MVYVCDGTMLQLSTLQSHDGQTNGENVFARRHLPT